MTVMKLILCFCQRTNQNGVSLGEVMKLKAYNGKHRTVREDFLQKAASCGSIGSGTEREELNEGSSLAKCFMVHTLQIIESSLKIYGRVSYEILLCQPEKSNYTAGTMSLPFPAQQWKFQTGRDTTLSSQLPQ